MANIKTYIHPADYTLSRDLLVCKRHHRFGRVNHAQMLAAKNYSISLCWQNTKLYYLIYYLFIIIQMDPLWFHHIIYLSIR